MGHEAADPFNDGSRLGAGIGGDLKLGIGSNLTLDATVNPDFGQVEVDPAVVNLSDVETFFDERRPVLRRGGQHLRVRLRRRQRLLGLQLGQSQISSTAGGSGARRRQSFPTTCDYSSVPSGTNIIGAAKLSGKVADWSLGALNAVTSREHARFSLGPSAGSRRWSRSPTTACTGPRRRWRPGAMVWDSSGP